VIRSMTGFGRGQAAESGYSFTVEVRTVNGRYTEVNVRLPRALAALESHVAERVQARVNRGSVSVIVSLDSGNGQSPLGQQVAVDLALAESYKRAIEQMRDQLGLKDAVSLDMLARLNDVIVVRQTAVDEELAARLVDEGLRIALDELEAMRAREGEALAADFRARLASLAGLLAKVEARAPQRVEEYRQRLADRIANLLKADVVDEQRIALEVAVMADRSDVTEECVRFRSHLEQFERIMGEEMAGRKFNFLLQEMNREANTIGSKANDATLSHIVVEMKDEIERLREQVQNVE